MDKGSLKRHKKRHSNLALIYNNWINCNIFELKKWDGVSYFVLYILIPVIITGVSISALPNNDISIIYCYVTILISALNGIYDGANRWDSCAKSMRNVKIFLIGVTNAIIGGYCLFIIFYILICNDTNCRNDMILFVYFITIVISSYDVVACFAKNMALRDLTSEEMMK